MNNIIIVVFTLFFLTTVVKAEYVLPYPSVMPGNKMYGVLKIIDTIKGYWSWGNVAQTTYHLSQSDKNLVEAKTLFEYKQYLLAVEALKKSDAEFREVPTYIQHAFGEGKDISHYVERYVMAARKHEEVLQHTILIVPADFHWTPEKDDATFLALHDILQQSKAIRNELAKDMTAFYQCTHAAGKDVSKSFIKETCEKDKQQYYPTSEPIMEIDDETLLPVDSSYNDQEGYL